MSNAETFAPVDCRPCEVEATRQRKAEWMAARGLVERPGRACLDYVIKGRKASVGSSCADGCGKGRRRWRWWDHVDIFRQPDTGLRVLTVQPYPATFGFEDQAALSLLEIEYPVTVTVERTGWYGCGTWYIEFTSGSRFDTA